MQVALSAAATLWDGGEDVEALKWLRRAASTAADRDADARAIELFKAAADLASELDAARSSAPPSPTSTPLPLASRSPTSTPVPLASRPPSSTPSLLAPRPSSPSSQPAPSIVRPPSRPREFGSDSTIVPAVPPETSVTEGVPGVLGRRVDETEEDTFIRPETMLRRALMAIDPDYAKRIDYAAHEASERRRLGSSRGPSSHPEPRSTRRTQLSDTALAPLDGMLSGRASSAQESEPPDEEDTRRRRSSLGPRGSSAPSLVPSGGWLAGALPAVRVAVLPIPEERDVRLLFLPPGAEAPPGVAVALLVPTTDEDAALLARIYAESDAKL